MFTSPSTMREAAVVRDALRRTYADAGVDEALEGADGPLGRPPAAAGLRVGNRFCVHPMEGWDAEPDGTPSAATFRRWRRFGLSGAKLVWGGEAFAVQADGRANPNQLYMPDDPAAARPGLEALLAELKAGHAEAGLTEDGLVVGLQLTHSGRFSRPTADGPAPRIAYRHPVLDPRVGVTDDAAVLTDGELEGIAERYVLAARLARDVGFDFVDVKCCHGYLLHETLSARRRPGHFGGAFENRIALLCGIVDAIRHECPELEVGVRMSVSDVFPHRNDDGRGVPDGLAENLPYDCGFGVDPDDPLSPALDEPLALIRTLESIGVSMVNVTIGSPYTCPHAQRPAAYPPSDGYAPPHDPIDSVARHLEVTAKVKAAFPALAVVGTGYSYLQEWVAHVAQHEVRAGHVDFVGLGRMMLSYPDLCADVLAGRPLDRKKICRTFSDCTTGPRNGMVSGCFPLDPYYRERPEAAEIKRLRSKRS